MQLQFVVYLLMVLGPGIAAWRKVLELGPGQTAVARDQSRLDRTDFSVDSPPYTDTGQVPIECH